MKRILISLLLVLGIFLTKTSAQFASDTISYSETLNGFNFSYLNQSISSKEVSSLIENNPDAYDAFESGREAKVFGYVFFTVGSSLILYPFITSIMGKETNWGFTIAGMGFVGLSIPIFNNYHKKTKQALELYNSSLSTPTGSLLNKSLNLGLTESGLGLSYRF